tara:strand:- start:891 stop:1088 length:198 start_codon:yes stop_codon:yes gene_type:complete
MKTINILGRGAVIFLFGLFLESIFTEFYIFNCELWEHWLAWVVQAAIIILGIWATAEWCKQDDII